MLRYIARRMGYMLITLVVISMIIFFLAEVVPVDPARSILGAYTTDENVAALRKKMGLDEPVVERYFTWLGRALRGDLGESFRLGVKIRPLLLTRFRNSLYLAFFALVMMIPFALLAGILSGLYEGKWPDNIISTVGLIATSLPEFVTGIVFIIIFSWWLDWLPGNSLPGGEDGNPLSEPSRLVLPALVLVVSQFSYIARITRVSVSKVLKSAYVRTAILKGLPYRTVIFKHVLRNALLAPVTVITTNIGWMLGGLIVIETVFSYPGLGRLFAGAAIFNDIPLLEASALIGVLFAAFSQLTADILYAYLNPRIRYS